MGRLNRFIERLVTDRVELFKRKEEKEEEERCLLFEKHVQGKGDVISLLKTFNVESSVI